MALSSSGLGDAIKSKLMAVVNPTNPDELDKFAMAIGEAVVEYITASAIVVGTVTSGQGAGGAVQGTVT
jgi:hypothetical protein